MSNMKELYKDYAFHFLNDLENPVMQVLAIGKQIRIQNTYQWDNRERRACYLFQYTLSGSVSLEMDNQTYIVDQGKGFFIKIPSPSRYYFDALKNEAPYEHIYIMFVCKQATAYCEYIEKHLGHVFSLDFYSPAVQLLLDMYANAENNKIDNPFLLSSSLFEFLCLLCSQRLNTVHNNLGIVSRAQDYMEKHCTKPIGINDAANALQVSQSHLSRAFYQQTGEKPVVYLTKLRLKKAIKLLTATALKIEDISEKCGFASSNYFDKVFKKYMHVTPKQFRLYVQAQGFSNVQI